MIRISSRKPQRAPKRGKKDVAKIRQARACNAGKIFFLNLRKHVFFPAACSSSMQIVQIPGNYLQHLSQLSLPPYPSPHKKPASRSSHGFQINQTRVVFWLLNFAPELAVLCNLQEEFRLDNLKARLMLEWILFPRPGMLFETHALCSGA